MPEKPPNGYNCERKKENIMAVNENKQSKQDLDTENREIADKKLDVTSMILSTLDLPIDTKKEKTPIASPKKGEKKDEEILEVDEKSLTAEEVKRKKKLEKASGDEDEEFESDKTDEEILETKDKDLNEQELRYKKQLVADKNDDDDDEELIPKSKFKKTIEKMQKRIDKLVADSHKEKPAATSADPDIARLEKMSVEKLQSTKEAVRKEIRETTRKLAKGEDVDEKRLDDLEDLADKIDEAAKTFSSRLHRKQVTLYNEVADEIANDPEIENLDEAAPEIKKIAEGIYNEYPKLKSSEEGQAMALRLATDHWKLKKTFSIGKSKADNLRKSHKRLLRKTTLDSNVIKGDQKKTGLKALKERAGKGSTMEDKHAFIKESPEFNIDALIPSEFKEK